jgi:hypothetical protein
MTVDRLVTRVVVDSAAVTAAMALLALPLLGPGASLGVAAAGALTALNFWGLGREVRQGVRPGRGPGAWALGAGLRFGGLLVAFGGLFAWGVAEPLAVVVGLLVVPVVLIVRSLHAARGEAS